MQETWYELNLSTYTLTPVTVVGETEQTIQLVHTFVSGSQRVLRTFKKSTYNEYYPTQEEAFEALGALLQNRHSYYKKRLEEVEEAQAKLNEHKHHEFIKTRKGEAE